MWEVDGLTHFKNEIIVPKGIIEVIFNFGGDVGINCEIDDKQFQIGHCFVNGFNTSPIQLSLPAHQHFFGIRLQPLAVKKILKTPASELLNTPVDTLLLNREFDSLWQMLGEQPNFGKRVHAFLQWIEKMVFDHDPHQQLINRFLTGNEHHDISVKALAGLFCYSPRHLSRKLVEITGLNAEELLLYKKYLQSIHLLHNSELPLTSVAYQSNFSDQSHFIRTFKYFTQMTPKQYKLKRTLREGHFFENVR